MVDRDVLAQMLHGLTRDLTSKWGNTYRDYNWACLIPRKDSKSGSYDAALIVNYGTKDSLVFLFLGNSKGKAVAAGARILVSSNFKGTLSDETFRLTDDIVCRLSEMGALELKKANDTVDAVAERCINGILEFHDGRGLKENEFLYVRVAIRDNKLYLDPHTGRSDMVRLPRNLAK